MKKENVVIQEIIQRTQALIARLSPENQAYFDKINEYMVLSSLLRDERAIREQIYQMVLDFSDAERDGISAQEFFGNAPKGMADELVNNSPRIHLKSALFISGLIGVILAFCRLLSSFSSSTYLTISPFLYLSDVVLGLFGIGLIFLVLAKTVYSHYTKWVIGVSSVFLVAVGLLVRWLAEENLATFFVFIISNPWDVVLMGMSFLICLFAIRRDKVFQPMLFPVGGMILTGLLKRWTKEMQITDTLWTTIIPIAIIIVSLLIFYGSSYYVFKKNK
ncbi:Uncharacterised protein [Streptococcus constellatus]|uniref:DUF1129 family protein n=1 Tax=Streptococcus constellatus TaxID=76860 RepID=A0A564TNP0_STRCV|nr:hypothetical protein [Streptococcus constellatus]VUX02531.1 Uncharacterised protein [Streptococcus gordonii]VUX08874.1 Uncharacterised protein [Streptococcus constellatus]